MTDLFLEVRGLKKSFNRRTVFSDLNFGLAATESLAITGRNGSGKSTLVKILAGVLSPTSGSVHLSVGRTEVEALYRYEHIGFVAPYLQLYDEFTAWEHLEMMRKIRGRRQSDDVLAALLRRVNLYERKDHHVRVYSSGMKQRLKYACALLHQPLILILDEPASNLDEEGTAMVCDVMREQVQGGILIVATNEREDAEQCISSIDLNVFTREPVGATG